ncbi:hypothetical protein EVAR_23726_1 [Eumeta japonica]|uniref:Uncharacterized protein n=1 Tax=Eumeta variegata TaxID=151549 RepID=A0A4C1VHB3_EUMVA|nr:hypothetical protein EVAR_23726_1 [Eumeta japonica]
MRARSVDSSLKIEIKNNGIVVGSTSDGYEWWKDSFVVRADGAAAQRLAVLKLKPGVRSCAIAVQRCGRVVLWPTAHCPSAHKNGPALLVKHHTFTEHGREVAAIAVAFRLIYSGRCRRFRAITERPRRPPPPSASAPVGRGTRLGGHINVCVTIINFAGGIRSIAVKC